MFSIILKIYQLIWFNVLPSINLSLNIVSEFNKNHCTGCVHSAVVECPSSNQEFQSLAFVNNCDKGQEILKNALQSHCHNSRIQNRTFMSINNTQIQTRLAFRNHTRQTQPYILESSIHKIFHLESFIPKLLNMNLKPVYVY